MHLVARGDTAAISSAAWRSSRSPGRSSSTGKDETLGEDWKRFAAVTSNVPFTAIVEGRNRLVLGELGGKRIAAGIIAFAILLLAHPYLFRVRAW